MVVKLPNLTPLDLNAPETPEEELNRTISDILDHPLDPWKWENFIYPPDKFWPHMWCEERIPELNPNNGKHTRWSCSYCNRHEYLVDPYVLEPCPARPKEPRGGDHRSKNRRKKHVYRRRKDGKV